MPLWVWIGGGTICAAAAVVIGVTAWRAIGRAIHSAVDAERERSSAEVAELRSEVAANALGRDAMKHDIREFLEGHGIEVVIPDDDPGDELARKRRRRRETLAGIPIAGIPAAWVYDHGKGAAYTSGALTLAGLAAGAIWLLPDGQPVETDDGFNAAPLITIEPTTTVTARATVTPAPLPIGVGVGRSGGTVGGPVSDDGAEPAKPSVTEPLSRPPTSEPPRTPRPEPPRSPDPTFDPPRTPEPPDPRPTETDEPKHDNVCLLDVDLPLGIELEVLCRED